MLVEEFFAAQRQAREIHLALQERLRERRALIGEIRLVGDERDGALKTVFAKTGGGLHAGVAGSDDDDGLVAHNASRAAL